MSYTVSTDPSGNRLDLLNSIVYTNNNLKPIHNFTYQLRNNNGITVSDNFAPYSAPRGLPRPNFLRANYKNRLYIADYVGYICTLNPLTNTLVSIPIQQKTLLTTHPYGMAFDSSGILYISTEFTKVVSYDPSTNITTYVNSSTIYKIDEATQNMTPFNITDVSLNDVRGITFDSLGNLYIADRGNNVIIQVQMIDYNNGKGNIFIPYFAGLNGPNDITFDKLGTNLYIANTNDNNIIKVSSSGIISIFATGSFNVPVSLRFDNNGILYVTNFGTTLTNGYINKITNGIISSFDVSGVTIQHPYGIEIDTSNNMHVTNSINGDEINVDGENQIFKIPITFKVDAVSSVNTTQITALAFNSSQKLYLTEYSEATGLPYDPNPPRPSPPYPLYQGAIWDVSNNVAFYDASSIPILKNPTSMIYDLSGNLYIANVKSNNIIKILPNSTSTIFLDNATNSCGVFMNNPCSIAFDPSYTFMYVCDYFGNNIVKVNFAAPTPSGGTLLTINGGIILNRPNAIVFDTSGNLYISNSGSNQIIQVSSIVSSIGTGIVYNDTITGSILNEPFSMAFDSGRNLYVSNDNNKSMVTITNDGFVSYFNYNAILNAYDPSLSITNPSCIAFDSSNNLYLTDVHQFYKTTGPTSPYIPYNSVYKLRPTYTGTVEYDSLIDSFQSALYALPDASANVYVSSSVIYKMDILDDITTFSSDASLNGQIAMAFNSSGRLYTLNNLTQSTATGIFIYTVDSTGLIVQPVVVTGASFNNPTDIIFDNTNSNTLYVANYGNNNIIKVTLTSTTAGTGIILPITGLSPPIKYPYRLAVDTYNNLYIGHDTVIDFSNNFIVQVNLSTNVGNKYVEIPFYPSYAINPFFLATGVALDKKGYLYVVQLNYNQVFTVLYKSTSPVTSATNSLTPIAYIAYNNVVSSLKYITSENSLVIAQRGTNDIDKYYLSFPFDVSNTGLGPYKNTLTINLAFIPDYYASTVTKFNVYSYYVVVDPSFIRINTPSSASIYFINPSILPNPIDSYVLTNSTGTTSVSSTMVNNKIVIGPLQIPGSTYPTGIVYSYTYNEFYVTLQNNTISLVTTTDQINYSIINNFINATAGLLGPITPVVDISGNIYILNSKGTTITQIQYAGGQLIVNNNYYTGISNPIYLTIDTSNYNNLYLLSGSSPNFIITQIPIETPTSPVNILLPLGTLNNPLALSIDEYILGYKYLYITETNPAGQNLIYSINLSTVPTPTIYTVNVLSNLVSIGNSMTNKNDGYLYVTNNVSNTISKIAIDPSYITIDPWMTTCTYNPNGLSFDASGVLFVSNGGTNPNNNKITQIYTDNFRFNNIILNTTGVNTLKIYDLNTSSFVSGGSFNLNGIP